MEGILMDENTIDVKATIVEEDKPKVEETKSEVIESTVEQSSKEVTKEEEKIIQEAIEEYTHDPQPTPKVVQPRVDLDAYSRAVDYMCNLVLAGQGGSTDENAVCLFKMFERIRKDGGKINFSTYNRMTPALQREMRNAAKASGIYRIQDIQMFTSTTVMQMYQDLTIDSEWEKLQNDIKKASRMPEQMDIFGEVIYDKMVNNSLLKMVTLKTRRPDEVGWQLFQSVARTYLNQYYFIDLMNMVWGTLNEFKKKNKNPKRLIDDVDYVFQRVGIKTSIHTEAKTLYDKIVAKFGEPEALSYLIGIKLVLNEACADPKGVRAQETAFLTSQFMGILAYINDDEEVRTDFGNQLVKNFKFYITFCKMIDRIIVTPELMNHEIGIVDDLLIEAFGEDQLDYYHSFKNEELPMEFIKFASKNMHIQYNKAVEAAIQKYETDIASKLDEDEKNSVNIPADTNTNSVSSGEDNTIDSSESLNAGSTTES